VLDRVGKPLSFPVSFKGFVGGLDEMTARNKKYAAAGGAAKKKK